MPMNVEKMDEHGPNVYPLNRAGGSTCRSSGGARQNKGLGVRRKSNGCRDMWKAQSFPMVSLGKSTRLGFTRHYSSWLKGWFSPWFPYVSGWRDDFGVGESRTWWIWPTNPKQQGFELWPNPDHQIQTTHVFFVQHTHSIGSAAIQIWWGCHKLPHNHQEKHRHTYFEGRSNHLLETRTTEVWLAPRLCAVCLWVRLVSTFSRDGAVSASSVELQQAVCGGPISCVVWIGSTSTKKVVLDYNPIQKSQASVMHCAYLVSFMFTVLWRSPNCSMTC